MRRLILAAACAVLAAGLAGCGKNEPAKPARTRVGIVAKSLGNGFFDAVHKGADEAAKHEAQQRVLLLGAGTG